MTRGLIVAISANNIIGVDGTLPWSYPLDLRRFSDVTRDSTVIMGRVTYESIGSRPLPRRRNIVVTSKSDLGEPKVEVFRSIREAVEASEGDVWFIGGSRVYEEALQGGYVDLIDATYVPDMPSHTGATHFNLELYMRNMFVRDFSIEHPDPRLKVVRYYKMGSLDAHVLLKRHFVSESCGGETCVMCDRPATHKLGEEIMHDDPHPQRHNLTAHVCCEHYTAVLGSATGCPKE